MTDFIKRLLSANRFSLVLLAISSALTGILNALFIGIVNYCLTSKSGARQDFALMFVAICVAIIVIRHYHRYIALIVAHKVTNQLRLQLVDVIRRCSAVKIEEHGRARLLTILTYDINTLSAFILSVPLMFAHMAFLVGAAGYLAYISDIYVFGSLMLAAAISIWGYFKVTTYAQGLVKKVSVQHELIMSHLTDLIGGYKELKMKPEMGEAFVADYLAPANQELAELQVKIGIQHSFGLNFGQTAVYVLIGVVIFGLPEAFHRDTGVLIGYVIAILYAASPLEAIIENYPIFARANVSVKRISALEQELIQSHEIYAPRKIARSMAFSTLTLKGIEFSYMGKVREKINFGPFNLNISSGEVVFLTGGNGCGKTTLAKLMCGLYRPSRGQVLMNGRLIDDASISDFRSQFSTMFSDFYILSHSPGLYDIERLRHHPMSETFGLSDVLRAECETIPVTALSQGQKRRLAILIALVDCCPVYIFDEPGAELDPGFKNLFYEIVLPELKAKGKTVIVVTHDDNYFSGADRVLYLRDGKIHSDTLVCEERHA